MYVSSYLSLQTALSGVEAAQEELDTTGNNIANENDTDYESESVSLSPSMSLSLAAGQSANGLQLGTGVAAGAVINASDPYLDSAYRTQNSATSAANETQTYAGQLQDLLGENNNNDGAISAQLSSFWSDWNELSDNPGNAGAQQSVVDDGEELASSINTLSTGITSLQSQAAAQYDNLTQDAPGGQVYDDVTQLASLNGQIAQATAGGAADNSLLDQRNAVIDDLSSLATVQVTNNSDGSVNLSFGGVTDLVQGTTVNWPSSGSGSGSGSTMGTSGFTFPGDASSVGGTLGALLGFGASGGTADQVNSQLDTFATSLATEVNTATAASTSGVTQFFSITNGGGPGSAAASLAVNSALLSSPSEVPTASTSNPGANDIALAVSQLSGGAADQSYDGLVESVGGITQQASNNATDQSTMLTQISNQRESAEGVDQNQELANLISEEQSYQASAKVMSTFSTMMDSLMEVVGQ